MSYWLLLGFVNLSLAPFVGVRAYVFYYVHCSCVRYICFVWLQWHDNKVNKTSQFCQMWTLQSSVGSQKMLIRRGRLNKKDESLINDCVRWQCEDLLLECCQCQCFWWINADAWVIRCGRNVIEKRSLNTLVFFLFYWYTRCYMFCPTFRTQCPSSGACTLLFVLLSCFILLTR